MKDGFLPGGPGELCELPRPRPVHAPVLPEKAENKTVRAGLQQGAPVLQADGELRLAVAEAALPGPDHGHDGQPSFPLGYAQGTDGGREAPVKQIAAKLRPIRAAQLRLDHIVRAAAADLQQNR